MAENHEPVNLEPTAPRIPPPGPRRRTSSERQTPATPDKGNDPMSDFMDSVQLLAKNFTGEAAETTDKERAGRRIKKFQRSGLSEERTHLASATNRADAGGETANPPVPPHPTPAEDKLDAAAFNKNVAWPRIGQVDTPAEQADTATRHPRKKRRKGVVLAVVQGTGFGLLLFGFWLGRQTASTGDANDGQPTTPAPMTTPAPGENFRVSERALQAVNDALRMAHHGDLQGAENRFKQVLAEQPEVRGVQYQLAQLETRSGSSLDADLPLERSSDAGEFLAACCYMRARTAGLKGDYGRAAREFQTAAHEEPFDGASFFYWGEALRRAGQPKSAVSVLDQALERVHTGSDGAVYLFKQRLAKVEAGDDEAFNAELAEYLKQTPVPGDFLLLSAAQDILQGKFAAAAESLKKASTVLPAGVYDLLVKDYLYQSAANEPLLIPLVQRPILPDSTEQSGPVLDPVVAAPRLADPAIWPVAAK